MTRSIVAGVAVLAVVGFVAALHADTLILANGQRVTGTVVGIASGTITFKDPGGTSRRYPTEEVVAVEFSSPQTQRAIAKVLFLGAGSEFSVQTSEVIDSSVSSATQLFSATFLEDFGNEAGVTVPKSSSAQLVICEVTKPAGGEGPQMRLDIQSITIDGRRYRVAADHARPAPDAPPVKRRLAGDFSKSPASNGAPVIRLVTVPADVAGASVVVGEGTVPGVDASPGNHVRVAAGTLLSFTLSAPITLQSDR